MAPNRRAVARRQHSLIDQAVHRAGAKVLLHGLGHKGDLVGRGDVQHRMSVPLAQLRICVGPTAQVEACRSSVVNLCPLHPPGSESCRRTLSTPRTLYPALIKARAQALPMPVGRAVPVTTAVRAGPTALILASGCWVNTAVGSICGDAM